tara:strand:- start:2088 stop:2486 length:399 start_codon:yes stop_codon:yes gene_type:complete
MDFNKLESLLENVEKKSKEEDLKYKNIIHKINNEIDNSSYIEKNEIINFKNEYYNTFSKYEGIYQRKNDQYKELISTFSKAYLEISDFYVGDNLPREHYLQSKHDIETLYFLFYFFAFAEPYLEAYHKKYCS